MSYRQDHAENPCTICGAAPGVSCEHDEGAVQSAQTEFTQLKEELHALMKLKRDTRKLILLNVGTDHRGEWHWRFKTASGQIITLSMEIESAQ